MTLGSLAPSKMEQSLADPSVKPMGSPQMVFLSGSVYSLTLRYACDWHSTLAWLCGVA